MRTSHTLEEIGRAVKLASILHLSQPVIPQWINDIIDEGERQLGKHEEVILGRMLDAGAFDEVTA